MQPFDIGQTARPSVAYTISFALFIISNCFFSVMYKSVITSKIMAPKQLKVINSIDDLRQHPEVGIMVTKDGYIHNYMKAMNFTASLPNKFFLVPFDQQKQYGKIMATNLQQGISNYA